MSEDQEVTTPVGIGTYLRKIESQEGAAAALKAANRWLNVLEEMHLIACPTMHTLRPGGPQKLCTTVLIVAIMRYLKDNDLYKQQMEAAAEIEEAGDNPADYEEKPEPKKAKAEKPNPDDAGKGC